MAFEETCFRITWRIEDFSLWAGGTDKPYIPYPWTPIFCIEALSNAKWQFSINPRTLQDNLSFGFARVANCSAEKNISVRYRNYLIGKHGLPYLCNYGVLSNPKLGESIFVDMICREDIPLEHLPNDQFTYSCEIQQSSMPVPECSAIQDPMSCNERPADACINGYYDGKWPDELESLSKAMEDLFLTGHHSDLKLVTDDGHEIAAHSFLLFARWKDLRDCIYNLDGPIKQIAVRGLSGSFLSGLVSCLYSGILPGECVTVELFEFVTENFPRMRQLFHSSPSEVSMRTRQRKEHLAFTWHVGKNGPMPVFRAFPLFEVECKEVLVELDTGVNKETDEECLTVAFSLSRVCEECVLRCTVTLFSGDVQITTMSASHRFQNMEQWEFPSSIPMRLLDTSDPCHRLEFDVEISDEPIPSDLENWVTTFHTGSPAIHNIQLLALDLKEYFTMHPIGLDAIHLRHYDVVFRCDGGQFLSHRAVLSARSRLFRQFFRNRKRHRIVLSIRDFESIIVYSVLEYVYTGWTNLRAVRVCRVLELAHLLSLLSLKKKCERLLRHRLDQEENDLNL